MTFSTVQLWASTEPANPSDTSTSTYCNTTSQRVAGVMIDYATRVEQAKTTATRIKTR